MSFNTQPSVSLEQIALSFNVPRELAYPILRDFQKWCQLSGEEWAIGRMKDFQVNLIRWLGGLDPMYGTWVALSSDGAPKGHFGGLFRWVAANPTRKRRLMAISFLRMYTFCKSSSVTSKQEAKFLGGVQAEPTPVSVDLVGGLIRGAELLGLRRGRLPFPGPILTMPMSDSKRHPMPDGKTVPETHGVTLSLSFLTQTSLGRELHCKYPDIFKSVMRGVIAKRVGGEIHSHSDNVGKVGFIQEPGYKLRAVANPARVYQRALEPLGRRLFETLQSLPWDCTHNQSLPNLVLQQALRDGRTLHCVDLSGATDYFPLDLQLPLLHYLTLGDPGVSLFEDISKAPWRYGDAFVAWQRGQPLGLLPSFASFALTHGLLLFALNGFRFDNQFFVLGDDVVILDDVLASVYRGVLVELGCPISPNKTLGSHLLGEFAGKVFFKDAVLPQLKWRDPSDESFMDFTRNFGRQAFGLLRKRQRRVAQALQDIPDFLGGLGWNPKGLPLEDRVKKYYDLFDREFPHGCYLMSYDERLRRAFYDEAYHSEAGHFTIEPDRVSGEVTSMLRTFDQNVSALIDSKLPALVRWRNILGPNLFTVDPELGLPQNGVGSSFRRTTLETLEAKLA